MGDDEIRMGHVVEGRNNSRTVGDKMMGAAIPWTIAASTNIAKTAGVERWGDVPFARFD